MTKTPPIDWPVVTVDGKEYEVRYNFRVAYRASKAGIDTRNMGVFTGTLGAHTDLFALCVAHHFEDKNEVAPTADEWAARFDFETFKVIAKAVQRAMVLYHGKTSPVVEPLTLPETTEGKQPN